MVSLAVAMTTGYLPVQDILVTLEDYADSYNLKFSTDPNPVKCKTKCVAFLLKLRYLPNMILCGNPLPWVDTLTHLGTKVTNKINGCQEDLRLKKAAYIQKNCSIIQEFSLVILIQRQRSNLMISTIAIFLDHHSGTFLVHVCRALKAHLIAQLN